MMFLWITLQGIKVIIDAVTLRLRAIVVFYSLSWIV